MSDSLKKIEIGTYEYDSDNEEWDVRMDEKFYFSCKTQFEAEVLSTLVRIERLLKKSSPHGDVGNDKIQP